MSKHPVVVYGASGYTGRLICEYLRGYNLPFIAAGRDKARTEAAMALVPGIETAVYEVVEVEHTVAALSELFDGAKVVCNTVGPFYELGHEVVDACLATGAHYLDTTGEQAWMLDVQTKHSDAYADAGLLLAPCIAQMYTTGEIAANIALETPGVDQLDMLVLWKGAPTTASTETIFATLATDHMYLEDNELHQWDPLAHFEVTVPGQHQKALAVAWGGTANPVWFKDDPRVSTCKTLGGVFNQELMQGVIDISKIVEEQIRPLPTKEERDAALQPIKDSVAAPMPPRENHRINRSLDSVYATGPLGSVHVLLQGSSNYQQTALLNAYGAHQLVRGGRPRVVGFGSGCQAWGHRELLTLLQTYGLMGKPQVTSAI